ncbi:hypothetical protein [Aquimarina spongiae]|uniref:EF-hand domain-containing protein n=1 Tax=Aquimarina spongiae TaxID=570521 RepID=A0A1M6HBJ9_9FLAO|nr:hypothetical protein [Aquimarina spongiae]SHJ19562.1 hypothetical protein SAMN04488508_106192 [Aquimarina spongiae]
MKRILSLLIFSMLFLGAFVACENEGFDINGSVSKVIDAQGKASCPGSHPYEACGACWTDAAQAQSGGCTDTSGGNTGGSGNDGGNNQNNDCPSSHPFSACGQCWTDANQAQAGGCNDSGDNNGDGDNNGGGDNTGGGTPCGSFNYNPNNTACVTTVANGSGCMNSDGLFVSVRGVVSNPCNTKEAVLDIERNLGIDIDDQFIEMSGYQGNVPSINPTMTKSDFLIYMKELLKGININGKTGDQFATEFTNLLDTNNDGILTRNEASQAKGSDPRQVLNLEPIFTINGGLATDDVLAYVGLYLGDGALDKYAGDLPQLVQDNMASFTRTWQPGVNAASKRYDTRK